MKLRKTRKDFTQAEHDLLVKIVGGMIGEEDEQEFDQPEVRGLYHLLRDCIELWGYSLTIEEEVT